MLSHTILSLALAASASAHMILNYPRPFGRATLNSSPLAPSDFPCKQRNGVYAVDTMNQWDAGETRTVSFNGTAVHGGGSCQFSITTDPEPSAKSQWKVIQSVIGGCPADQPGNIPEVPNADPLMVHSDLSASFPVTMPSTIPDGRYTFAWTWVNTLGNREFYMNCAPIQVGSSSATASSASASQALSALPDMFVINLPDTQCTTTAQEDFVYPNPGQNVVYAPSQFKPAKTAGGTGSACAAMNALGAGASQIGSPSAGTPSTPSQGTTPSKGEPQASQKPASSPVQSKVPSNPGGGVFAPGASSAPVAVPTPQPSTPAAKPTPPAANPVPSTTPQTPGDNNTTPTNGDCTPCTNEGGVVCIGSKQFGLCNRGCAVAQDLAAGMACSGGAVVAATKRHVHFPRAHLHRRFTAAHFL